ncbi:hypothetical protein PSAC2689_30144 [Paraburkholderia sacchari]
MGFVSGVLSGVVGLCVECSCSRRGNRIHDDAPMRAGWRGPVRTEFDVIHGCGWCAGLRCAARSWGGGGVAAGWRFSGPDFLPLWGGRRAVPDRYFNHAFNEPLGGSSAVRWQPA